MGAGGTPAADASLTAIGDLDRLLVGSAGYCGERTEVSKESWPLVALRSGERVWIHASSLYRLPRPQRDRQCTIERNFVPAADTAYILRVSHVPGDCRVELFRAVPGGDPVRVPIARSEPEVCLLKP